MSTRAGFTLIEVLVALTVVAITLPVVGSLMEANVEGTTRVEQRVTLLAAYRSLEANLPDRSHLLPGSSSGQIDGITWSMEVRALGEDETGTRSAGAWVPLAIAITLRAPGRERFRVETLRLGRRALSP